MRDNCGIHAPDAFIDRFAVVDIWEFEYNISDYVMYSVLPNSIMRGIIEVIMDNLKPLPLEVDIRGSREPRHAMNVKSIMRAMNIHFDDTSIRSVVTGTLTFELKFRGTPTNTDDIYKMFPDYRIIRDKLKDLTN